MRLEPAAGGDAPPPHARSELGQWPIQLHLANPHSGLFQDADLLLAADCTAFACGSFHTELLRGRKLLIACPKLDSNQEIYEEKLVQILRTGVRSLTVAIMEVPCCRGLEALAREALTQSGSNLKLELKVVSIRDGSMR
ncbi:MAG: iron-sulfur cluster-binding oxidoreductase [Planctomycetes bacterium]|nr:iron-sulfur cluster-binding oxidoreductase [Planctomycetota bacterium]